MLDAKNFRDKSARGDDTAPCRRCSAEEGWRRVEKSAKLATWWNSMTSAPVRSDMEVMGQNKILGEGRTLLAGGVRGKRANGCIKLHNGGHREDDSRYSWIIRSQYPRDRIYLTSNTSLIKWFAIAQYIFNVLFFQNKNVSVIYFLNIFIIFIAYGFIYLSEYIFFFL